MADDAQQMLVDLQTRLAFQDQTITELNDVIADQQKQIDLLKAEVKMLTEKIEDLDESLRTTEENEKPPHY